MMNHEPDYAPDNRRLTWKAIIAVLVIVYLLFMLAPMLQSAQIRFEWINAIERVDGSDFLATDIERTNVYCNDELIGFVTNDATLLTVDLPSGTYQCYATHVDRVSGLESDPSNIVTKVVDYVKSNPPTLFP